jgi:ankyrin repeat protein
MQLSISFSFLAIVFYFSKLFLLYFCVEMLMDAITTQKFKLARIMITGGVNVNISVSGLTPLMIACLIPLKNDNEDKHHFIELLLECGANLNARDNFGGA